MQAPIYLEQALFAAATNRLRASVTANLQKPQGILEAIEHVLRDATYTQATAEFAERHRDYRFDNVAKQMIDELEQLLDASAAVQS